MLMPKKNRVCIYEHLFKEGVLVAKKDFHLAKHPEIGVPNLHVIKALHSLKSRGYVTEQFSWCYFYWYLTNDGITYLRNFLHLPSEIVPATLKRQIRQEMVRPRPVIPKAEPRPPEDRAAYRRVGSGGYWGGPDKKADVGVGMGDLEFRGSFGRGRGAPM